MPRPKGSKNNYEWASRVDNVVCKILEVDEYKRGSKNARLLREDVAKEFGCSTRQADKYIAAARKRIAEFASVKAHEAFQKALEDRALLLIKAKELKDWKLALDIVKDRDKLRGLYTENINYSGEIKLTQDDLKKLNEKGLAMLLEGKDYNEVIKDKSNLILN